MQASAGDVEGVKRRVKIGPATRRIANALIASGSVMAGLNPATQPDRPRKHTAC